MTDTSKKIVDAIHNGEMNDARDLVFQGISTPFGEYGGTLLYKFNDAEDFMINIDKFYKDPELQLKLSDNSSELCNSLSGENKFKKNWERIEEMLYE